jgi:hypothetical protein
MWGKDNENEQGDRQRDLPDLPSCDSGSRFSGAAEQKRRTRGRGPGISHPDVKACQVIEESKKEILP